ncbi:MAG TPA: YeeE/YedE family protein [Rhodocyclaceae bacterium]|nr:YeeE/YedE family protein [Rhodocyclaceae bacterium]
MSILIDWTHFTPLAALCGGALIGIAAAVLVFFNGRLAGISGVLGGLLSAAWRPLAAETSWRAAFMVGLLLAPWLFRVFTPLPVPHIEATTPLLIVAGLLVGIGTRYASGCTSGHGVCGLSRVSPRSLVATPLFMAAGFFTTYLVRHLLVGYLFGGGSP